MGFVVLTVRVGERLGFCRADHTGNCLAHFIMGSSFIAYAIIMTLMLLVGQAWLKRTGKSQEFWDSGVIAIWGMSCSQPRS